ncbi:hypothetical protein Syun_001718 [Stephania yunnanensis]|uniref:Uncharacterized protein n=1 Tax=Stephania yunnanensis TaxID=152371 RepID=A0AAP0LFD4_9MAGN
MATLRNQELVFKNQGALARSIHRMEHTMSRRNRCQGGTVVHVSSTQVRLPLSSNLDVPTLSGKEYHFYNPAMSYKSQRIDPVEDDDDVTSRRRH